MSEAKIDVFDELVDMTERSLSPVIRRLRKIIIEIDSDACGVVRLGDRAATYGVGPKKMSEGNVYLLPHKSWVNIGFYQGADLKDPKNLLEGTGGKMRHVKIPSIEDADRLSIQTLIQEALKERRKALGPKRPGYKRGRQGRYVFQPIAGTTKRYVFQPAFINRNAR